VGAVDQHLGARGVGLIDLPAWVAAETQPERRAFRQAVQLVLRAIAQSPTLSPFMIMKGGVLLAIRYQSSRFTTDIDFSTPRRFQDVHLPTFIASIEDALAPVSSDNEHGLALRLQSHEVKPPHRPEASFPTLQMRIGYASRLKPRLIERLRTTGSPHVVQIDYSFNEWASDTEQQDIDGGSLSMYPFHDLVAEKIRSVLQQPIRRHERFQDIYDLFLLLENAPEITDGDRAEILKKLVESSRDRHVPVHREAMRDKSVIELSRRQYDTILPGLVSGKLPDFDTAYTAVREFFESLPWESQS
jgi:predicted nucleotidyltransferase component of viral defense system